MRRSTDPGPTLRNRDIALREFNLVWQISGGSPRAHDIDNPKVTIRRGTLGAFYLKIEGTNSSPRVKRLQ